MSILIRSMEIPTSCDKCRFCVNGFTDTAPMYECAAQSYENVSVLVESNGEPFDFRPDWCPLVEIPIPHGRLIDIKSVEYGKFTAVGNEYQRWWNGALDSVVDNAPTVIEAEGETDA